MITDFMLDTLFTTATKNAKDGDFKLLLELIEYGLNNRGSEFNTILDLTGNYLIELAQIK